MRPLIPSIGAVLGIAGVALAQNMGGGTGQQMAVGQTYKNFWFPDYEAGKLKAVMIAAVAKGVTQNRAETTDLTIKLYDNNVVTTTITSPKADLYVNERKMRTKNTVLIVRQDQEASAQSCDFDLTDKKYLLRTHVRVILKHFNPGAAPAPEGSTASDPVPTKPETATAASAAPGKEPAPETSVSTTPPVAPDAHNK